MERILRALLCALENEFRGQRACLNTAERYLRAGFLTPLCWHVERESATRLVLQDLLAQEIDGR